MTTLTIHDETTSGQKTNTFTLDCLTERLAPNDRYLCIVPKQGNADDGKVLLPFEGDHTLSVIISKAFLLADDAKIKDSTILSQINRA
jgi:hypothetical protein